MVINYTSKRSVTLTAKLLTIEEEEIVFATATKHQSTKLTLLLGVTLAHLPLGHTANACLTPPLYPRLAVSALISSNTSVQPCV